MINPDQIPDAVVEAVERALHTEDWKVAIAAAINAWPGVEYKADVAFPAFGRGPAAIILPCRRRKRRDE